MPTATHYETFIELIESLFNGISFIYKKEHINLEQTIISAYDIIKDVDEPKTSIEKYISSLPTDFIRTAKSELYRKGKGWIDRGIIERKIIRYKEKDKIKLVPVLSPDLAVGIDSSTNIIIICCFDNYESGIHYVNKFLNIPKSGAKNEYKWHKLDSINRTYIISELEKLLNISCKGLFAIHTNLINSSNHLTMNQFIGLIEGCFSGYENDPTQNNIYRQKLKQFFFNFCDDTGIHCDPDFRPLTRDRIVRQLVRRLSKRKGKIQDCKPIYVTLQSHESHPIQLADLIVGSLGSQILMDIKPPEPCKHLYFDERKLSKKVKKEGGWAKAYYWLREKLD